MTISWISPDRRAYPLLAGRDIEVDCRRRLGVRWFSSSLPPYLYLALPTSFGHEVATDLETAGTTQLRGWSFAQLIRSSVP